MFVPVPDPLLNLRTVEENTLVVGLQRPIEQAGDHLAVLLQSH